MDARTVRVVFSDATHGYAAVDRLRAAGFQIDLAGSAAGDLVVSVQADPDRVAELRVLVEGQGGRIETTQETDRR